MIPALLLVSALAILVVFLSYDRPRRFKPDVRISDKRSVERFLDSATVRRVTSPYNPKGDK